MSKGIKGVRGLIQYTWPDRIESIRRQAKERAFKDYVVGFGQHAYEVTRTCPECRTKTVKAVAAGLNREGSEAIHGEISLSLYDFNSCKVVAIWKCENCGHTERKEVSFEELRQDFNNPALRH